MLPETGRKLKAFVILAMFSVSEGRRVSSRILVSGLQSDGSAFNADGGAEEGVYNEPFEQLRAISEEPDFQWHAKHFADQIDAIMDVPEVQEQAEQALEQFLSISEDPVVQEKAYRFAEQISALGELIAEGNLDGQDFQELVELALEQLKMIMQDPLIQENSKLLAERMQALMTDSEVQQHAKLAIENPIFQKTSDTVSEMLEAMMTDQNIGLGALMEAIGGEKMWAPKGEASSLVEVSREFLVPLKKVITRKSILPPQGRTAAMRHKAAPGGGELQNGGQSARASPPKMLKMREDDIGMLPSVGRWDPFKIQEEGQERYRRLVDMQIQRGHLATAAFLGAIAVAFWGPSIAYAADSYYMSAEAEETQAKVLAIIAGIVLVSPILGIQAVRGAISKMASEDELIANEFKGAKDPLWGRAKQKADKEAALKRAMDAEKKKNRFFGR